MAIAIRGTTPATAGTASNPVSVTLNGTRQPNANDVLVIIHANDFYALTNMATPTVGGSSTGVTSIADADKGTNQGHFKSWYYIVGSTGDLTVSSTETGSADEEKALAVYVLSGVDTASPIDGSAATSTSTSDDPTPVAPSVSPTSTDAFLICHTNSGPQNTGAYTHPSGMTETYDFVVNSSALGMGGAILQLSASGATGTKSFSTAGSNSWLTLSVAMKTSGAAPPVPDLFVVKSNLQLR